VSKYTLNIADFTTTPGPRFRSMGDSSAEEYFFDYILKVLQNEDFNHLTINLSNTWGYGPSFTSQLGVYFLEHFNVMGEVKNKVTLISDDSKEPIERFWNQLALENKRIENE